MIIAINGPAASGKGTLARMLAKTLELPHYDFGLMYRAIAFLEHEYGVDQVIEHISRGWLRVSDGKMMFRWLNLTEPLSSEESGLKAAKLASRMPDRLVAMSQSMVHHHSFVCDGRTCGIEIYPEAEYVFRIVADEQERANRRVKGNPDELETFLTRENLDVARVQNFPSCILLDTTGKTKEESLQEILSYILRQT